jgi:hypothetical protein
MTYNPSKSLSPKLLDLGLSCGRDMESELIRNWNHSTIEPIDELEEALEIINSLGCEKLLELSVEVLESG